MQRIWKKSTRSSGGANNCVEVADEGAEGVGVRDSKNPTPELWFDRDTFGRFLDAVKRGEFDL